MSIAFNNIRVNKSYRLVNYGEIYDFTVSEIIPGDYVLKDLHTLDHYNMSTLIGQGRGPDFSLREYR